MAFCAAVPACVVTWIHENRVARLDEQRKRVVALRVAIGQVLVANDLQNTKSESRARGREVSNAHGVVSF